MSKAMGKEEKGLKHSYSSPTNLFYGKWPTLITSNLLLSGLRPPTNLDFSEITSRSFRTTWTAPATNAISYLVRFRKAEDVTGDYISLAVPGDTTTAVLPHLFPLTAYEVNIFAQYKEGDSFPLTGEETTLEGKRELLGPQPIL